MKPKSTVLKFHTIHIFIRIPIVYTKRFFSLQFSPRPPSGNSIALKATNFQFREINI